MYNLKEAFGTCPILGSLLLPVHLGDAQLLIQSNATTKATNTRNTGNIYGGKLLSSETIMARLVQGNHTNEW
jgi:hypothetical protein